MEKISVRFHIAFEDNGTIAELELGTEVNPDGDEFLRHVRRINQADAVALPDWIDEKKLICDMDTLIERAREGEERAKKALLAS